MLDDFLYVHKKALEKTKGNFKAIPLLWIHLIVYTLIFVVILGNLGVLLRGTGYLGGILYTILRAMVFSHLLYTLDRLVNYNKIHWKDLKEGFTKYLSPSITIFFAYYILELLANILLSNIRGISPLINLLVKLGFFISFAAAAEYIYIGGTYSYDSLIQSTKLASENPINWTLFNAVLFIIFNRIGFSLDIFRPSFNLRPQTLVLLLFLSSYLIYRGYLFKELYMSTRRKREYMRK